MALSSSAAASASASASALSALAANNKTSSNGNGNVNGMFYHEYDDEESNDGIIIVPVEYLVNRPSDSQQVNLHAKEQEKYNLVTYAKNRFSPIGMMVTDCFPMSTPTSASASASAAAAAAASSSSAIGFCLVLIHKSGVNAHTQNLTKEERSARVYIYLSNPAANFYFVSKMSKAAELQRQKAVTLSTYQVEWNKRYPKVPWHLLAGQTVDAMFMNQLTDKQQHELVFANEAGSLFSTTRRFAMTVGVDINKVKAKHTAKTFDIDEPKVNVRIPILY